MIPVHSTHALPGEAGNIPKSARHVHPPNPKHEQAKLAHVHIHITNTRPEHVRPLAQLQQIVFPELAPEERFTAQKYLKHIELFPEGQFVAIAQYEGKDIVIGATSTFRTNFDFDHIQHTYLEAIAHGWLTNHEPDGEWLYGVDVSVHPDYRGLRIGRRLYDARRALVRKLNLRGEIAGALIPGYVHHTHLTVAQYALKVWQDTIHDPTLSVQIRNGFVPKGILYDHINDPRSDHAAVLIVRENPHYVPSQTSEETQPYAIQALSAADTVTTSVVSDKTSTAAANAPHHAKAAAKNAHSTHEIVRDHARGDAAAVG